MRCRGDQDDGLDALLEQNRFGKGGILCGVLGFILEQLLSNSVKYTRTGGVRIYMENAALVVEDTGIGIRKEDLPRIFEKGYTGYNGRMDTRASGIGLYLVKRAADGLGISISVTSEVGKGTRVSLRFPAYDEFEHM